MTYNERMAAYMVARYHARRTALIAELGGKCMQCGTTEDLELDHVDPATKTADIGKLLSRGEARYRAEAKKCQLLCRRHHRLKSKRERSVQHGGGITGKKNCRCGLCRPLKNAYASERKRNKRALEAQLDELRILTP